MVYKNNQGTNQWKIGMFWTPCEAPCLFLFNCLCAPCGAYRQRERLLGDVSSDALTRPRSASLPPVDAV